MPHTRMNTRGELLCDNLAEVIHPSRTRRSQVPVPTSPKSYHLDGRWLGWSARIISVRQHTTKGFYLRLALFLLSSPALDCARGRAILVRARQRERERGLAWEIWHRSSLVCCLMIVFQSIQNCSVHPTPGPSQRCKPVLLLSIRECTTIVTIRLKLLPGSRLPTGDGCIRVV